MQKLCENKYKVSQWVKFKDLGMFVIQLLTNNKLIVVVL